MLCFELWQNCQSMSTKTVVLIQIDQGLPANVLSINLQNFKMKRRHTNNSFHSPTGSLCKNGHMNLPNSYELFSLGVWWITEEEYWTVLTSIQVDCFMWGWCQFGLGHFEKFTIARCPISSECKRNVVMMTAQSQVL